jgi:hypothetical protein
MLGNIGSATAYIYSIKTGTTKDVEYVLDGQEESVKNCFFSTDGDSTASWMCILDEDTLQVIAETGITLSYSEMLKSVGGRTLAGIRPSLTSTPRTSTQA